MLTRRRFMAASIAGGALLRARASFAMAAQPATATGIRRAAEPRALRPGLREDLGRLSLLEPGAGLRRRGAARAGAGRRQSGAHRLGHGLAAPELGVGAQGDRGHAPVPDR